MANGTVVAIFISPIAGGKMEEVEIAEAIAGAGLASTVTPRARVASTENGRGDGR